MKPDNAIDYLEFPSKDLEATKTFFTALAGWRFQDYGPEYTAFDDGKATGGFYLSKAVSSADQGAPVVVLYHTQREVTHARGSELGGRITQEIFSFPGGRRFQFAEPGGSEFAFWSE
ncbi:MAG: VOC family protein [Verrucomicrobiales bacterium]|nr:VOC family protein [Verrucomicrobiales bacterium]